jgi:hypothetical protein
MKNIQVIDGAINSVYDIFSATEDEFSLIFPEGQDVAFIDEVMARGPSEELALRVQQYMEASSRKTRCHGNTRASVLRNGAQENLLPDAP